MSTSQNSDNQFRPALPTPLYAWLSGFDYVFGYQLKLVKELWGIDEEA